MGKGRCLLLPVALALVTASCRPQWSDYRFVGKWQSKRYGSIVQFKANGTVIVTGPVRSQTDSSSYKVVAPGCIEIRHGRNRSTWVEACTYVFADSLMVLTYPGHRVDTLRRHDPAKAFRAQSQSRQSHASRPQRQEVRPEQEPEQLGQESVVQPKPREIEREERRRERTAVSRQARQRRETPARRATRTSPRPTKERR